MYILINVNMVIGNKMGKAIPYVKVTNIVLNINA